jgi:peptidyl-prolyl cis-trans isomerase C
MRRMQRCWWTAPVLVLSCLSASAQPPAPSPPVSSVPPVALGVAARVNGQPIPESAVDRALDRVPPAKRDEARKQILDFLVENVLLDQYVLQLPQYAIEKKDVDAKEEEVRAELKKQNKEFPKMLEEMKLTEAELREQIAADLRWTKFCADMAKEDQLRQLFELEKVLFDGTMVRARHILLTPSMTDPKAVADAAVRLRAIKQEVEAKVDAGLAKLPAGTEPLAREKERRALLDDAFAAAAKEKSQCPSKVDGGDVNYFQRSGKMVEPFAKAAFALKPFEMSDVVQTQFGVHLILLTERKPGLEVKFADVKDDVKDEFCDRLREQVVAKLKPRANIVITPAPKSAVLPAPMLK